MIERVSAECYALKCDHKNCANESDKYFDSVEQANEFIDNPENDWQCRNGKHLCPECVNGAWRF
jgi:hypothetical protein